MQCGFALFLFLTCYSETGPEWVLGHFALIEIALQVFWVICCDYCLSFLVLFRTFVWIV